MKTAILTLTQNGLEIARRCRLALSGEVNIFGPIEVVGSAPTEPGVFAWEGPLNEIVPALWNGHDAVVAVMALGIVVRLFGPLTSDKRRDPAVVVVDDAGRFAIAVLGGHGAGANGLAQAVALALGAQAVITTASDASGLPAADQIGLEDGWIIEQAENLTRVAAAVVRRQPVAVWQDAGTRDWWPRFGEWPAHFHRVGGIEEWRELEPSATLLISDRATPDELANDRTVVYRPPTLVAGIGCKRGTSHETIDRWVTEVFDARGLALASLAAVATVMLKLDEPGLVAFARSRGLPLVAFPAGRLANHPGIETPSAMVRSKVGLDGVAEPAALLAAGALKLLVPKQKGPGVTVAVAVARRSSG